MTGFHTTDALIAAVLLAVAALALTVQARR